MPILYRKFEEQISTTFTSEMIRYSNNEMEHITECLSGLNLFNLTDRPLSDEINEWISHGPKFNPYVKKPMHVLLQQFDESFISCTNKIFRRSLKQKGVITDKKTIHNDLNALKRTKPCSARLISSLQASYTEKRSQFKQHLRRLNYSTQSDLLVSDAQLEEVFSLEDDRLIVQSDKNLGFVIMDTVTYLDAYHKINAEQHFVEAPITESWYIENIVNYVKKAAESIPTELSNIIKPSDFDNNIENPSLGHLRLLPKIQKLSKVDHTQVHLLRCRGIKSSLQDPIKIIQKVLDKVYSHLLFYIEGEFNTKYGRMSPSVSGVNEALERIKHLKTGAWGTTQLDGDFENMFSNCHKELLERHVRHGAELAGLGEDSIQFIFNLIHVNMEHSYFKEPAGIFHTTRGYSMGDMSASRGTEVVLRDSELGTFEALHTRDLLDKVEDYFRFKDDVHAHPDGTIEQVLEAIYIISTTYPQDIKLNVEINIFQGKFLNLRMYNTIDSDNMFTTILRKRNSKYDVIPPNSNTCKSYKSCAGRTYFDMTRTHCNDRIEQARQVRTVKLIMSLKNFSGPQICNMSRKRHLKPLRDKLYTGKIEHDGPSQIHKFLRNVFRDSELDPEVYALPMTVPGKKILQYVFTLRKLRKKLNF